VARRLLVGRSNITMLLPQMEKQGLLRREGDAKDKRILRLYLTERGEALLMEALKVYSNLIDQVMAQSTPAECDSMGATMLRIEQMLDKS
jgi:DNA-binding MarR family transcriptional regulator